MPLIVDAKAAMDKYNETAPPFKMVSVQQLAEKADVPYKALVNYRSGKCRRPDLDQLERIAKVLNCTVYGMFRWED